MYFISGTFILFLAAVVLLYYIVPKKVQWMLLLCANLAFYMWGGAKTVLYLVFTTVTTYAAGILLDKLNNKRKEVPKTDKEALERLKKQKKAVVAGSLGLNFGMLFMLKYLGFTLDMVASAASVFGVDLTVSAPSFLMPLGVSFYIFQSTGYVVDMYRGKYKAERNILKFSLFTSFFPQMVQGPISRFDKLGHQLTEYHPLNTDNIRDGIQIMMWGYFKKMVIADRAAVIVTTFFADYNSYGGAVTAFSVMMYCINLYCDFSGGIDITRGAARLLGIELEENFRRPIFATSLSEHWRRWHITLGGWMRDYVFYPLSLSKPFARLGKWAREKIGGKLGKILATSAATFVVYLIIGIWHGANFRYIAYGFWNGAIITSSLLLAEPYSKLKNMLHIKSDAKWWQVFSMARTCFIVFIGRYITRSPRLLVALSLIVYTFTPSTFAISDLWNGTILGMGLTGRDLLIVAVSVLAMLVYEWYEEYRGSVTATLAKKNAFVQWIAIFIPLIVILLFGIMRGSYISSEFIYKQY